MRVQAGGLECRLGLAVLSHASHWHSREAISSVQAWCRRGHPPRHGHQFLDWEVRRSCVRVGILSCGSFSRKGPGRLYGAYVCEGADNSDLWYLKPHSGNSNDYLPGTVWSIWTAFWKRAILPRSLVILFHLFLFLLAPRIRVSSLLSSSHLAILLHTVIYD
ncbi:hypothetical protein F5884DRAFT_56836 [Xylogone sp. PMI_703]|nr:hypothetical protein F5884DRAFT_56836 [Xylogone sp. PMI_703]